MEMFGNRSIRDISKIYAKILCGVDEILHFSDFSINEDSILLYFVSRVLSNCSRIVLEYVSPLASKYTPRMNGTCF